MRGLAVSFIVRRMGSSRLLLGCILLTTVITAALIAALTSFWVQALPQSVSNQLGRSGAMSVTISGQVGAQVAAADGRAVRAAMRRVFGPVPFRLDGALWSDPLGFTKPENGGPARPGGPKGGSSGRPAVPGNGRTIRLCEAAAPGQIRPNTVLVNGAWPGPPGRGGPIPAALPAAVASQLHAGPGTVLALRDRDTGRRVRLRVTGLFKPRDPRALYWGLDLVGTSGASVLPPFVTYGPLVVSPAAFGRGGLTVGQVSWVALPDPARIRGDLAGLAARIDRAETFLRTTAGLGGLQADSGIPRVLASTGRNLAVSRSLLTIGALQFLLLAAAALALPARLLASHRDEESALLSARGAKRWQLVRPGLAEAALLGGAAAAVGALAGSRLAGLLVNARALRAADVRVTGIPAGVWWAGLGILALCTVIMLGSALRPATPGEARVRRGRQAAVASVARAGGDLALLALAVVAVLELRTYSAVAHPAAGGIGIDPVPVAAPVLALAGVTLIPLRLLPFLARVVDRVTVGTRRLGAALASWEVSRRPVRQSGPVLLVVLAVATGTLALAQHQSWRRSAQDQAAFAVGADVRVAAPRPATLATGGTVARAPGVSAATPVNRVGLGSGGELLAVDGRSAAAAVSLRRDLSPLPPATLWRGITPRRAAGFPLPGRAERLEIIASLARGAGSGRPRRAAVTVTVQDAAGIDYAVAAGTLAADGRVHRLAAVLSNSGLSNSGPSGTGPSGTGPSGTGRTAYPLRLLGVSLTYRLPPFAGRRSAGAAANHTATLTVSGLAAAPSSAGPFPAPFARGSALRGWRHSASAPGLGSLALTSFDAPGSPGLGYQPAVVPGAPASGRAMSLSFTVGEGADSGTLRAAGVSAADFVGVVSVTAPPPVTTVPGIATASFLDASHVRVGSVVPVTVSGVSVPVKITAAVTDFPTVTGHGGALIVDQAALRPVLAGRGAAPLPVTQWWLRTATGAAPAGLPAGSAVASRARLTAALLTNPLSVTPQQAVLAIAVASALLAVLGFSVSVAASLRARRVQSALLAALGVSRAGLTSQLCLEQLMLSLPATGTGLLAGVLIAHLVVPADTLTAAATLPVPPVLVEIPFGWVVWLALAVAAVPVAVAAVTVARHPDPASQLRSAEAV